MNLHEMLNNYMSLRRSLGYKLVSEKRTLTSFICYLRENKMEYVTTENALRWAKRSISKRPCRWGRRLSIIREFSNYLIALDHRTEVPPAGLLPSKHQRPTPFILSRQDINYLLLCMMKQPKTSMILKESLRFLFGLMSISGLRVSEALKLTDKNIDVSTGVMTVDHSKFGKSRLIPLHQSTISALQHYQSIRQKTFGVVDSLFVNQYGKPMNYECARYHFQKIFQSMGYPKQPEKRRATLHSLRHFFAISTITHWYETGEDVHAKLPILSAFLGHVETRDTYWYISACPSLMLAATQRLERDQGGK